MKVAFLTGHLSEASGGFSYAIPGMVAGLARCGGVDPYIFGIRDDRSPDAWRHWGVNVQAHRQIGMRAFGWAPKLPGALRRLAPDIVDAQGLWMYPSLVSLARHRRSGGPYAVTPHGMLDPWTLRRSAWKKRLVGTWFEKEHLQRASCLRATARMEADHLRAYGLRNPIAVVPNGLDMPPLGPRPCVAGSKRRLLFLSRLHPKKGIGHLLRAWVRLSGVHLNWELVIAGPDEIGHRAEMQRLAADLEARDVIWHEPVHGEAKSALYRSADLFILPTHAENFGLVVAEALAHEVPVITTTNAPWDELKIHRCGWWTDLTDNALVAAMDEAMALSDTERYTMGARGRAWIARDFAWPTIACQMQEVYTWVLGGGPPPACVITD